MRRIAVTVLGWLFSLQSGVYAAPPSIQLTNPTGVQTFKDLAQQIGGYLWEVSVPVLTIMFLIGGFQMLTARDNPEKFKKGRMTIQYAAIGAAVILIAQGIIYVIENVLGVSNP